MSAPFCVRGKDWHSIMERNTGTKNRICLERGGSSHGKTPGSRR